MEITIYELLGLVKNGKAPKKIEFNDEIWMFNKDFNQYQTNNNGGNIWSGYNFNILNNTVKIIDIEYLANDLGNRLMKPFYDNLEDQKKIPEKLDVLVEVMSSDKIGALTNEIGEIQRRFNQLIDYLKNKGE